GIRPYRDIRPQASFFTALYRRVVGKPLSVKEWVRTFTWENADFMSDDGTVPVTVLEVAPAPQDLGARQGKLLEQAVNGWAEVAHHLLWLPATLTHRVLTVMAPTA